MHTTSETRTGSLRRALVALGAVALLTLGTAAPGAAQGMDASKWTLDGRAGAALPTGEVADLNIDDLGFAGNLGVGYRVHPRVTVRADGGYEQFSGDAIGQVPPGSALAPTLRLFHYTAGVEVELTPPEASRFDVTASVAGGATTWDTDEFTSDGTRTDFSETYLTANGGLEVGYQVSRTATVFLGGQWYMQFTDETETQPLAGTAGLSEGFDTASTVPLYAGIELTL